MPLKKNIKRHYAKKYPGCPESCFVGRNYVLTKAAEYYRIIFEKGTVVQYQGIVITKIKTKPAQAAFLFPDKSIRYLPEASVTLQTTENPDG